MSLETPRGDIGAFAYLTRLVGRRALVEVAAWLILASATEGIGLLLLVPLTRVIAGGDLPGLDVRWAQQIAQLPLAVLLGGFVALVTLRAAIMYRVRGKRVMLGLTLTRKLRSKIQRAIVGAEWRWLSGERSGDYGALVVGQSERLGHLADRSVELVTVAVTFVVLIGTAFWLAWRLTLLTVALAAIFVAIAVLFRSRKQRSGAAFDAAYRQLQQHVTEGFVHLRAARIASAEEVLTREFDHVTGELQSAEWHYARAAQRAELALQVVTAAILAAIVFAGLRLLSVPLVLFVPVLAIFLRMAPLAGHLQEGWRSWRYCRPALETLLGTVDAAARAAEPQVAAGEPLPFTREIALEDVTLTFDGRGKPLFDRFCLTIPQGFVVAVAGPSGSGKSTLADLLSGLLAPDAGRILVDGRPLEGADRVRWRRQVAYVEQSPYLIAGTIADNLAWGYTDASRAAMEQALVAASAAFVRDLPLGLETVVGELGRELSGGERQRISLARALLRQPSLIILDEATAALDAHNEAAIVSTIQTMRGEHTIVVLGHRPALWAIADYHVDLGSLDA